MPPAGAGAEDADLAVEALLRTHPFHGGLRVADDLGVRNAALGAHLGADIVGVALADALIEVGADGDVAVVGKLARHLAIELAPGREMVDQHDAREGPRPRGSRCIGRDRRALVAVDLYLLHGHATVCHVVTSLNAGTSVSDRREQPQSSGRGLKLSLPVVATPARAWPSEPPPLVQTVRLPREARTGTSAGSLGSNFTVSREGARQQGLEGGPAPSVGQTRKIRLVWGAAPQVAAFRSSPFSSRRQLSLFDWVPNMAKPSLPPGPKGHFLFGCLRELRRDFLGFMTACVREYGDVVPVKAASNKLLILGHPDAIQEALVRSGRHLTKSRLLKQHLCPVIGEGLLLSEGDFWLQQRRLMQAAFHHQRIAKYGDVMVSYARTAIADWKDGETRDIHSEMTALAQAIVGKTLFNIDFTDHAHCIGSALLVAMAATSNRRNRFSKLRERVRTRRGMGEAIQHLDHIVYDIIAARSRSSEKRDDLLGILLSAQNNEVGGRLLSDRQVRDELLTLSLAGQETSAVLLSCIWYLLAQHPQVQVRLETELDACLAGRAPTAADLPRLPYTEMVVKEAMRLLSTRPRGFSQRRRAVHDCWLPNRARDNADTPPVGDASGQPMVW